MSNYDHKKTEQKWTKAWYEDNIYEAIDFSEKPKKYIMAEFPYPSGHSLHAGHMMRYTVPDVYARYLRMNNYNVLFPMGWDAFGLPAENYAIKTGIHPEKITNETIKKYKQSIMKMGYGVDWAREISTTNPKYYKWTQWLFLNFYEQGLAEYVETPVWWCEELKTVLANEEVITDKDGNKISERGEAPVEKRMLKQWVLKMPAYAEKLIQGLEKVDFPDSIKKAQINWIGKSEGAKIDFKVEDEKITVFTTRPDTIYGTTFVVIAPEHPFVEKVIDKLENPEDVKEYIKTAKNKSNLERQIEKEKTGVELKGIKATVPFTGNKVPVFLADYVLMDYGTGFVMGVPAHDERDYEFAKKYDLEIIQVIKAPTDTDQEELYAGEGTMINSDKYNGMTTQEFRDVVTKDLEKNNEGKKAVDYKIRDWIFSRQRFWGEPIPLATTEDGNVVPICDIHDPKSVEENLPLELPKLPDYAPTSDGSSPLERNEEWLNIEIDGKKAKRETNTMPNWAGSCWYYLRYTDPRNDTAFADFEKMKYWLPVDRYFGGAEHTTMHLLYSRFWHKFFYDHGLVPTEEPYQWRLNGGLLLGPDGTKMSKSKGNVVAPIDLIENFSADALRMTICFLGPYEDTYPWNPASIKALHKFIQTVYRLNDKVTESVENKDIEKAYNLMVKNVTRMVKDLKMNTAVSEFMIFLNVIKKEEKIDKKIWKGFLKLLAPFAPFITEELWQEINNYTEWNKENSVHLQEWPTFDENILETDTITIPVQINGKVRAQVTVNKSDSKEDIEKLAITDENVKKYLENKEIIKSIYIPSKIFNFVVK